MFRPEPNDFVKAIGRALKLYADQARFVSVQRDAMQQDFSWASVVGHYEQLYNG